LVAPKPLEPVLKVETSVYFAPPEVSGVYTTMVTKDGQVLYIDNKHVRKEIARLSTDAVQKLLAEIEKVQSGELVKDDPNAPECMDAPSKTSTVVKADGTEVVVTQTLGCQPAMVANGYAIRNLAETFQSLVSSLR
jgi:hypothetical protein